MLHNKTILVVGGDLRQAELAKLLAADNRVYTLGLEKAEGIAGKELAAWDAQEAGAAFDYIVFPMPVGSDAETVNTPFSAKRIRIDDALALAGPDTHILGGKLNAAFLEKLQTRGLHYTDYFLREELSVLNAIPTAEGAIQIAMEELAVTIYGLKVLLIGYGRISRVLARLLKGMGAEVTVSARKFSDLAWIEANGYRPVNTYHLEETLPNCQLIVNTVPSAVLTEKLLSRISKGCLLIDLASKPGGVDFRTANKLGLKVIWALSLPGKVAPITAGKIIFQTMQNIDSERRASCGEA